MGEKQNQAFQLSLITKTAALRAIEASIQVGTGILIWRR